MAIAHPPDPAGGGPQAPANAYIPPIIGGVIFVISQILLWQRLPVVVAIFLGLFLFVGAALAGRAAMEVINPPHGRRGPKSPTQRMVERIIKTVGWILIVGMVFTFTSLFLGKPLDLRNLVRPDLVSRKPISSDPRPLTPIPFPDFEDVTVVAGASQEQQAKELENTLFQWIKSGAVPATQTDAVGFAFEIPSFDDYYEAFTAVLVFDKDVNPDPTTQKIEPLQARLVDGVALLQSTSENGQITYRQVPWIIDRHNGLQTDVLNAKTNKLFDVMPSKGERLLLIAKLTSMDKSQLVVGAANVACHLSINPN